MVACLLLTWMVVAPAQEADAPAPELQEELAGEPAVVTPQAAAPEETPLWKAWLLDVGVGSGVGAATGVLLPLVLALVGEAVVVGLAASMLQASRDGWGDLAAVAMMVVGNAALIPAVVLCVPCAETAGFVTGATLSAWLRKLAPPLRPSWDWQGQNPRTGMRAALAPVFSVAAAVPGLLLAGLVVAAGVAVVPLMFFLFNSVGIATLGPTLILTMALGSAALLGVGLVAYLLLAWGGRPLMYLLLTLGDRALAHRD